MPLALQLRCLKAMPNSSRLMASRSSSKKATRIFVKWRLGRTAIQFILVKVRCPAQCRTPKPIRRLLRRVSSRTVENIALSHRIAGVEELRPTRRLHRNRLQQWRLCRSRGQGVVPSAWGWAKGQPKAHAYYHRLLKQ